MTFSGPYLETQQLVGVFSGFIQTRKRYRQGAPYKEPLPYNFERAESVSLSNPWGIRYSGSFTTNSGASTPNAQALNKAYAQFVDAARGTSASMAVNLAERKQAVDMMAKRGAQLLKFARHLRRFEFPAAVRTLGFDVISSRDSKRYWKARVRRNNVDREVKFKRSAKAFGDNYLEFHFGWEPAVKDIYAAVELSTSSYFPGLRKICEGRGSVRAQLIDSPVVTSRGTYGSRTQYPFSSVRMGAEVQVDNPNLLLLNLYGVVNPAVVVWELVPFSFLVDWFVNISSVLNSYTDFVGLSLIRAYTSFKNLKVVTEYYSDYANYYKPPLVTFAYKRMSIVVTGRSVGITKPSVTMKSLKLPSVVRGLTAISLLTQFLGK